MIDGNTNFDAALGQSQKQPLYALIIDDFRLYLLSFRPDDVNVTTVGGYGVIQYGIGPYGN